MIWRECCRQRRTFASRRWCASTRPIFIRRVPRVIEAACFERGIEVIGHIPFDSTVTAAIVQGEPMTVHRPEAPASRALQNIWQRIATHLNGAGERL